ncbi:hypothetical protein [Streptomyces sp. UH6]|uniref:hypothetical protein n=1 Tax=Streptomyces sp. UH6 TaxID=2748379 RepID=UPI0015D4D14F|nr:hypothetical protein [Streptomyces sp. UH6]NYV73501.1 hypothetical protein [Streptomyces sp. UH6]
MNSTRARAPRRRPLVIAALLTGALAATAGVTVGVNAVDSGSSASDTIEVAAAKQAPTDCNTPWEQYKPRKTFMWNKTTGLFRVNDNVSVQFRSLGGEYYRRLDRNCKVVTAWKGNATMYRTWAKAPEAKVPRVSSWYTSKEYCGKPPSHKVNVIIGCYRGEFRYSTGQNH